VYDLRVFVEVHQAIYKHIVSHLGTIANHGGIGVVFSIESYLPSLYWRLIHKLPHILNGKGCDGKSGKRMNGGGRSNSGESMIVGNTGAS
jgi:hypothetical protein